MKILRMRLVSLGSDCADFERDGTQEFLAQQIQTLNAVKLEDSAGTKRSRRGR